MSIYMISTPYASDGCLQRRLYIFFTTLIAIFFAILFSLTPVSVDDLYFMIPSKGQERGLHLWEMMIDRFPHIRETQSGRLGNFLSLPFLYLFPRWVFGVLSGFITALLILLSCRMARVRYGSVVSWLLMASIVFAFPWYDYLTQITYACNYLWAATAVVGAMIVYLRINDISRNRLFWAYLLIFIAGWMHEGFGAPFTAGIGLYLIVKFRSISVREITAFFIAAIGTGMTLLSPTFWQRSGEEAILILKFTYQEAVMQLGPALLFFLVFLITGVIALIIPKFRRMPGIVPNFIMVAGFCIASSIVFLLYYNGPRTGAPLLLFSAIGCAMTFSILGQKVNSRAAQYASAFLIGGVSIAHLIYADIRQVDATKEYDEVVSLYEASPDGTIYYDLRYPTPDFSFFKNSVRQFHERIPKSFLRMYYSPEHDLVILPKDLAGFDGNNGKASIYTPHATIYEGWIILPVGTDVESFKRIHIKANGGQDMATRFRADRFRDINGGEHILITPHIKVLDPALQIEDVVMSDHSR